jgi:hypothetical protein
MNKIIYIILLSVIKSYPCYSQTNKQRLLLEISKQDCIECAHIGIAGKHSELFWKADTLNSLSHLSEIVDRCLDSNYTLKYYSFTWILHNEEKLSEWFVSRFIKNSAAICFRCGCTGGPSRFNELIVYEYYRYIKAKYLDGGTMVLGSDYKVYQFPKADKKSWKKKLKELKKQIKEANEIQLMKKLAY